MYTSQLLRWSTAAVFMLLLGIALGGGPARADETAAPPPEPKEQPKAEAPAPKPAEPVVERPPYDFLDEGLVEKEDGTVAYFYRTNFVKPNELQESLQKLLPIPGVAFKVFPRQNILIIEGEPEDVDLVLEAATYFDVASPQVFIEAKVIEITYDSNFEFGLDYLWSREQVGPTTLFRGAEAVLNPTSFIGSTLPGGLPFQGTSLLFGFVGKKAEKYGLADVTLQALQMDGKAEVLSRPSIIATENVDALVSTTEDRQIVAFQNADLNNERYGASTLTTGVSLKVKASHIGENFVTLKIDPEVKGFQGVSSSGSATLRPIVTTRKVSTTVTMADGETLVIGGLYTNASVVSKAKTPLLSDIPLLGQLFTRCQEAKAKTELVFMLTPTIVRKGTAELKVITPPSELERLEGTDDDCWRPAGPSLRFGRCKPSKPIAPTTAGAAPTTSATLPPPPVARTAVPPPAPPAPPYAPRPVTPSVRQPAPPTAPAAPRQPAASYPPPPAPPTAPAAPRLPATSYPPPPPPPPPPSR